MKIAPVLVPISANNEPIFTILVSFYGFLMMPSPFMKH